MNYLNWIPVKTKFPSFRSFAPWFVGVLLVASATFTLADDRVLPLAGEWGYRFDPDDKGFAEGWTNSLAAEGKTTLPGTTDTRGIGPVNSQLNELHLSRTHKYRGAVWFQREVEIPESWAGHAVTLKLERVQWESTVWVDGKPAGMQDSLSVPHRHDLTALLTPGRHMITLRVDNP